MDNTNINNGRQWKILCWNVRGINSQHKWTAIRSKVNEMGCDIICLQETKREDFDNSYLRNFCLLSFGCFDFIPSMGYSGCTIVIWKSSRFSGQVILQNEYSMNKEFPSVYSSATWILTNIYAPCSPEGKQEFLEWLHNIEMPDENDWLLVGDFNLIRCPSDRNKPSGNAQDKLKFNAAISNLRLKELRLNGNGFTWTNKQESPLL
jgi:exonuclease III